MSAKRLPTEKAALLHRLEEAEETVRAIRRGLVDAFVVEEPQGSQIYTLQGADRPYRLMVERMQEGAVTLFADGTIAYCNLRFATLLGKPHQQLTGANLRAFFPPEEQSAYEALFREGKAGASQGELHLQRSNGEPLPVHLTLNVLPKDCGAVVGVLVTDLTNQKHQEKLAAAHAALSDSEARLTTFLEQLPIGVGASDLNGRWIITNSVMRTFAPTTVPFRDPKRPARWKAFDGEGRPVPVAEWPGSRALRGEAGNHATEMIHTFEDGRSIWMRVSARPLRNPSGEVIGVISIVQDIDAAKRMEIALRESEERYRSLVSVITDVPWTTDAGGAFAAPQAAWSRYTGQTWDEYRGFGWVNALHPQDRDIVKATWQRALEARGLFEARGRVWHAHTQKYRHIEARATPVINFDGTVREWVGTCTDVHERVQAEEQLREADRSKDNFLAMLAHELRNPLAPIRSAAQVVKLLGPSDKNLAWSSNVIERQVAHLTRLVDDLLDVSRITRGKVELKKEVVELATAVASAVEANTSLIDAKEQELTVDIVPIVLSADLTRLTQIISNLLNNAAKYTPERGRLAIVAKLEDGAATIKVKDSGPGISSELLPHVFELFTQGKRSLDRTQGGLGIGLTIVMSLVDLHGGHIDVKSEPGNGTEFTVTLPALREYPRTESRSAEPNMETIKATKKILVVDDHPDGNETLSLLLQMLGYEVRSSFDGPSALEMARVFDPDVVLLDIGLPGMDGYEVARRLRQPSEREGPLLVAMTGYGQEEDKRQAFEAGFDLHLTKPVSREAVETLLERL